jgi:hypothetical protein
MGMRVIREVMTLGPIAIDVHECLLEAAETMRRVRVTTSL